MKIDKTLELTPFVPYTISITVQTELEQMVLHRLAAADERIPKLLREDWDRFGFKDKEQAMTILEDFLSNLFELT